MPFNRRSVATIDSPEFVNITSISPLVSKCEIKVLYVGANRNRSFISKEVATEMAQTLPGCPIVGYYIENKEDFGDHGDQVIIDAEGVKFKKLTQPYGFVAPDAKVWFQKFDDTDEFGNVETREYMMVEGYLWTGQFEECKRVVSNGNPQSMELDEKTLKGYWSTDNNKGVDFFIINDATFSKLCILGEDVEPCFEGANVTSPDVSAKFTKDENFVRTLYSMVQELQYTLNNQGGTSMDNQVTPVVEEEVVETTAEFSAEEGKNIETPVVEIENSTEEFAKKDDEEESKESDDKSSESDDSKEESSDDKKEEDDDKKKYTASKDDEEDKKEDKKEDEEKPSDDKEEKDEDDKKKYALLEEQYESLKSEYALLKEERDELLEFKNQIVDKQKDDLIQSFYMLSDEDKEDVIANKAQYSLEDIESKLSVICVRKKVSFEVASETSTEDAPVTFNLESPEVEVLPAWLKAVEDVQKRNS